MESTWIGVKDTKHTDAKVIQGSLHNSPFSHCRRNLASVSYQSPVFTWTFIKKDWRTLKFNLLQSVPPQTWRAPKAWLAETTNFHPGSYTSRHYHQAPSSQKFNQLVMKVLLSVAPSPTSPPQNREMLMWTRPSSPNSPPFFEDVKRDWAKWLRLSIIAQNETPHHLFTGSDSHSHTRTHRGSRQWLTSLYVSSLWLFQPSQLPKLSLPLLSVTPNRLTHVVKRHHSCADLDTFFIVLSA